MEVNKLIIIIIIIIILEFGFLRFLEDVITFEPF